VWPPRTPLGPVVSEATARGQLLEGLEKGLRSCVRENHRSIVCVPGVEDGSGELQRKGFDDRVLG